MAKLWMGSRPTHCDACTQELKDFFADAKTPMGQWGILCTACCRRMKIKFGTGLGQRYSLDTLEKVEG